jgi:hypothetical protein
MKSYTISASSTSRDLAPVALCIHEMLSRLPITARSLNQPGVRIEEGRVIDDAYSGPVLEEVLEVNRVVKRIPDSGQYKGVPVIVSPLHDEEGTLLGAIGVVDITGIFDLATLMEHQSTIVKQVCGKDPCPLPSELTGSKR